MASAIPEFLRHVPVVVVPTSVAAPRDGDEEPASSASLGSVWERDAHVLETYQNAVNEWVASNAFTSASQLYPLLDYSLRLFLAENVTGELGDEENEAAAEVLSRFHFGADDDARYVLRLLTADGEMPSPCVRYPALLLMCRAVVQATVTATGKPLFSLSVLPDALWSLRVHFRHQLCLVRRSHSIFHAILRCVEAIDAIASVDASSAEPGYFVEVGHVQNYFHRRDLAAQQFLKAAQVSGLKLSESAMLGVRTRWQQQQRVQAVLIAHSARPPTPNESPLCDSTDSDRQPTTVGSEKDGHDLLDFPRETPESAPVALTPLCSVDKAIILALCSHIRNQNPHHGLTAHHIQTYVERVISDPATAPYMIRSMTLLLRSRLEHGRSRVAQRAFLQMQELVDQFHHAKRDASARTFHRTAGPYVYWVAFPCIWTLKSEFASVCFEENLHKTALDLYEQVQDWEHIIECCKKLDKRKKAENFARELLEKDPHNPMLWVALGEATREDAHLWKAWELSHHKMAAPMRSLAKLALEREHYDKVIEYFDQAVRINPIFGGDWFTLGYATMRLKQLDRSGEAFTRVCQIDPNDAFAWNNLASVMLQQGKKRPAFSAMSQALRNNRRSWRMWQNYFSIAVELLEITEATHALQVILEIAQREVRLEAATMRHFVTAAIRYANGEIQATGNTGDESASGDSAPSSLPSDSGEIPERATFASLDGGEVEETELVPLAHDVELPSSFFPSKAQPPSCVPGSDDVQRDIRMRYRDRVTSVFTSILDLFVTDPELYHCAAEWKRFTDGPAAAFQVREKELRCAEHADQWCRTETLFARVVSCLSRMLADVADAAQVASSGESRAAAVALARSLVNHCDGALQQSAEHLEDTAPYRDLMIVRKRAYALTKDSQTVSS